MTTLDWQDLQYFSVLARLGTLSGAARELRVDHATVGRRVASLEAALGVRLIDRLPRSCPLTKEGVEIAALVDPMEAAARSVLRCARGTGSPLAAIVRVSASPAIATYCIAPYIAELRKAHPGLNLILQASSSVAVLGRGEADIALRMDRPRERGATAKKIAKIPFGLYANRKYAARSPETWEFIAFDEALDHVPQQAWLRQILAGRSIAFETSDLFGQLAAARAGAGVAVLPRLMGDGEASLRRLDAERAPPDRDLWLVAYPDLRRSPAVREVMAFVERCVERTVT